MIYISKEIQIDENELLLDFVRSSGPGGQNVNKVSTAVQLRFDIANTKSLPDDVKARIRDLAKNRITEAGILIIEAKKFRSQLKNRQDAIARLTSLILKAVEIPKKRLATKISAAQKRKRLEDKKRRADTKKMRHNNQLDIFGS
jgi:ribosome-associated protein